MVARAGSEAAGGRGSARARGRARANARGRVYRHPHFPAAAAARALTSEGCARAENAGAELARPALPSALRGAPRKREPDERAEDLCDAAFELGRQRREVTEAHRYFERRV